MAASMNSMSISLLKLSAFSHQTIRCLSFSALNKVPIHTPLFRVAQPCHHCSIQQSLFSHHRVQRYPSQTPTRTLPARQCSSQPQDEDSEEFDVLYRKIMVEVKGHDPAVLKSYKHYVQQAARELDIKIDQIDTPKYHVFRQSLLSSVHIFKKHQTQYEQRTHFVIFEFTQLTGSTADTFLEYIQRNLPEGVAMKVTKHCLEQMPDHLQPPVSTHTGQ